MSWEEGEPVEHPCPCGKGHYFIIHRSDDWGRFNERWDMACKVCDSAYGLHCYSFNHKGLVETSCGWAKKEQLAALEKAHRAAEAEERRLQTYLRKRYSKELQGYFVGKSKKAIWVELTENGKEYPSLPTFYGHVRHSGIEDVVCRYLDYRHINTLMRLLRPQDPELMARSKAVDDLRNARRKQDEKIRASLFR